MALTEIKTSGIADDAITDAKVDDNAAIAGSKINPDFGTQDLTIADKIIHSGDINTAVRFPAADTVSVETGGSERLRLTSDGKVGVNQSSPLHPMHINTAMGSSPSLIMIEMTGSNTTGGGGGIAFDTSATNSASNNGLFLATVSGERSASADGSNTLVFKTSKANVAGDGSLTSGPKTQMVITEDGNVGIGTSSPARLLTIHGNSGIALQNSTTGTGTSNGTHIWVSGNDLLLQNREASGVTKFFTSDTERMRLDADGRLLINHDSSTEVQGTNAFFQIEGTGSGHEGALGIYTNMASSEGAHLLFSKSRGTTAGSNTIVQADDRIADIGFAAADGNDKANLCAQIRVEIDDTPGADDVPGRITFRTTANGANSTSERLRITNDGRIRINRTSQISSDAHISLMGNFGSSGCGVEIQHQGNSGSNRDFIRFWNKNDDEAGSIEHSSSTGVAFQTSSDHRLKENIADITDGIERLKLLKPRKFSWKDAPELGLRDGFIAHEVSPAIPHCVSGEKDAVKEDGGIQIQTIEYSQLTPLLTAALQEAISKIETLETKVAALESA